RAGLAAFVSPCVLPLVPAYLAYLGSTPARAARSSFTSPLAEGGALSRPEREGGFNFALAGAAFVTGLSLIFILFFYAFSLAVQPIRAYVPVVAVVPGILMA